MKKLLCLLTAMICLLGTAGRASADGSSWQEDSSWPTFRLVGTWTTLKPAKEESRRYQSTFGPGRHYPGAGAYKPYKVTSAAALMREGEYVLVDMSYQTVGRRILYFREADLLNASVRDVSLRAYPATVTSTVQPLFGPGYAYDEVVMKTKKGNEKIRIGTGTRVNVFFEVNGWVFAEFDCALGVIRAWLPADRVR